MSLNNDIRNRLFELRDEKYARFQSNLTPGIPLESFIGVRVPKARKLAKEIYKNEDYKQFLSALPHDYFDENMLHGIILSEIRDYDKCIESVDAFLPYVDNWAVCDTMSPKVFKKNKDMLLEKIMEWSFSSHTYTCRFGLEMLMSHFLDDDYKSEYLEVPAKVRSNEYYVNMMIAWFFATALAKQWKDAVIYLEEHKLGTWVHNKSIQKSCESLRISDDKKQYLKSLRIKS